MSIGSCEMVAFLHARLAEDEGAANRAARKRKPPWRPEMYADGLVGGVNNSPEGASPSAHDRGHVAEAVSGAVAVHIARHDPARTLREVEAKRAILGRCIQQAAKEYDNAMEEDRTWVLWPVLFELAAVYNDHPDYRQEWKP